MRDLRIVLGRHHDGVDLDRPTIDVAHGQLTLRVRPQPRQATVLPHFALALHDAVCVVDRKRHQLRRLVAGVAEHQALVAGTLVEVQTFAFIDTLGDVRRLAIDGGQHRAGLVVEADVGVVVTDAPYRILRQLPVIDVGLGGDLA